MRFPVHCPRCDEMLFVSNLCCSNCSTQVSGDFGLPSFLQLSVEEQEFILEFVLSSGSLKEMAKKMNKSYPTVRNRLDELINKLKVLGNG